MLVLGVVYCVLVCMRVRVYLLFSFVRSFVGLCVGGAFRLHVFQCVRFVVRLVGWLFVCVLMCLCDRVLVCSSAWCTGLLVWCCLELICLALLVNDSFFGVVCFVFV